MGATRSQLIAQYNRAKKLLWIEHFREAANTITAGYFDTADLMAIGSRETNLDPKWLTKKGDNGHGAGLMQIDDRSFPEFTSSTKWKDARLGILKGAEVLMQKWNDLQKNAGKTLKVKTYSFKGPYVSGVTAQQIAIAAYNSGRWAAYHYTKGRHPDYGTTGKDYSADVMARARVFRELLGKDGMLDYPKDSAAVQPVNSKITETAKTATSLTPAVQPPPSQSGETAGEVTAKKETDTASGTETVEAKTLNQQPVTDTTAVSEPSPYRQIGFWQTIKNDIKALFGVNTPLQVGETLMERSQSVPEWAVAVIGKLAVIALVLSGLYFIGRLVHFAWDSWKQSQRTKLLAEINSDINRKDIVLVPQQDPAHTGGVTPK